MFGVCSCEIGLRKGQVLVKVCVRTWFVLICDCSKKDVRLNGCMYVHVCVRVWFVLMCDCIKKDVRLDGCMYVHVCAYMVCACM